MPIQSYTDMSKPMTKPLAGGVKPPVIGNPVKPSLSATPALTKPAINPMTKPAIQPMPINSLENSYSGSRNASPTNGSNTVGQTIGGNSFYNQGSGQQISPPIQQTPGGLQGEINNDRYGNPNANGSGYDYGQGGAGGSGNPGGSSGSSWGGGGGGTGQVRNTQGFDNFDEFRDSALAQAMRELNPRMEQNDAAFEQMMVSRGIQPGTAQYEAQRGNLDRRNSDLLTQANYGAQQQGLFAQNQAFNQDYQYDALANALQQTEIGAAANRYGSRMSSNASMYGSDASARASMYGADSRLAQAQMANALGYSRLNESGRQFDVNDIFRTQGQEIQAGLGYGNLDIQQQQQNRQDWQANQNAQQQWWNQGSGMLANTPGAQYSGSNNYVNSQQNAGQYAQNNQNQQNASTANLIGGIASMIPWSDKRLKENIEFVKTVDGVNVYDFDYIDKSLGADRYRGVMAQEVKETHPDAIAKLGGFMMVDYSKLPVDMEVISCQ